MRFGSTSFSSLRLLAGLLFLPPALAQVPGEPAPAPPGAEVYFVQPRNGERLRSPVHIIFGLRGMGVAPAGVEHEGTGHHHLLINEPPVDLSQPLGIADEIRHYSEGQTETRIQLAPGTYTLQLVLTDGRHRPHKPPVVSEKIVIHVK